MESCTRSLICLEQFSLNNVMNCLSDVKSKEQVVTHQQATCWREVVCPEPRRANGAPYILDGHNRLCFKSVRDLPISRGEPYFDHFNDILSKDDLEDDSGQMGFLRGSPPVRANNPLIHDVQFMRQASILGSPSGKSHGGKFSSTRVDKRSPYCGVSSFSGKPVIRIEGFTCGNSDSHCVVPAFA